MAPEERYGYQLLPSDDREGQVPEAEAPEAEAPDRQGSPGSWIAHPRSPQSIRRMVNYDGGLRYDLSKGPWVIHPHAPAVQMWYFYIAMLLLFDIVYLPMETAFSSEMPRNLVRGVDTLSTLCFSADICLQFFLQVPSPSGDYWIFNHSRIIRTYLTGFFLLDLLSVIPFCEFLAITSLHSEQRVYLLHLLQFLRFMRMLRFRHIIQKHQYDIDLSYFKRTVLYSAAIMLVSVHMMSCLWATLGNHQDGQNWLAKVKHDKMQEGIDDSSNSITGNILSTYCTSTYFALYTLTGIGYGDIVPTTIPEYFFIIGMMVLGSLVWAAIIGEIVSVIQHANMDENNHQEKMDAVLEMGREYGLSTDLRLRLQAYFCQLRVVRRTAFLQQIVARMNSELAIEFVHVIHRSWLSNIWWMRKVSKSTFVVQFTLEFLPLLFCPQECIVTADRLYVIQRGLCIHGRQVLSKDMVWGADMLLEQDHLRINKVTLAISYVHLLYLSREALQGLLARFPYEEEVVRKAYRRLCIFRGVVWRAQQEKAKEQRMRRAGTCAEAEAPRRPPQGGAAAPERRGGGDVRVCEGREEAEDQGLGVGELEEVDEIQQAIADTRQRLAALQEEVDRRLENVGKQVAEAVELLSDVVQAKQKKGWSVLPGRKSR